MRLAAFILAILLLAGDIDPTRGWQITLVVFTGIAAFRIHLWWPFSPRPALDVRMGAFLLAVLLLAGTIEPTKDWLIALAAVTGVAMVAPKLVSLDDNSSRVYWRRHGRTRWSRWDGEPFA